MFKRVICIALFCSFIILGGCAGDLDEGEAEQQITALVKTYYSALCSKDYEQARDMLYFPPGFDDSLRDRYSDYSGSPLLESYSIYETKKLTEIGYVKGIFSIRNSFNFIEATAAIVIAILRRKKLCFVPKVLALRHVIW